MADKVWILIMEDSDGARSYYYVPTEWYDWISQVKPASELLHNIPESLKQSYLKNAWEGKLPDDLEEWSFELKTLQILAEEENYIGHSMKQVYQWFIDHNYNIQDMYELDGTWY